MTVEAHFVTFYSPGTFVAETTQKPIASWNTEAASAMAADIKERYGARPYAFRFSTRSRSDDELDSKETASSGLYYLGGKVETLAEVKARNSPDERILLLNMEGNGYARIWRSTEGWSWTQPLRDGDVVLPAS